jgi:hypothetical protein
MRKTVDGYGLVIGSIKQFKTILDYALQIIVTYALVSLVTIFIGLLVNASNGGHSPSYGFRPVPVPQPQQLSTDTSSLNYLKKIFQLTDSVTSRRGPHRKQLSIVILFLHA